MVVTAFDRWFEATLDREGPFTMFLILFEAAPTTILPLRSSYLHVIGPDLDWTQLVTLLDEAGASWDSVGIFAAKAPGGTPLPDVTARQRLASLEAAVVRDRLTVQKGELFDQEGRRLSLDLAAGTS